MVEENALVLDKIIIIVLLNILINTFVIRNKIQFYKTGLTIILITLKFWLYSQKKRKYISYLNY